MSDRKLRYVKRIKALKWRLSEVFLQGKMHWAVIEDFTINSEWRWHASFHEKYYACTCTRACLVWYTLYMYIQRALDPLFISLYQIQKWNVKEGRNVTKEFWFHSEGIWLICGLVSRDERSCKQGTILWSIWVNVTCTASLDFLINNSQAAKFSAQHIVTLLSFTEGFSKMWSTRHCTEWSSLEIMMKLISTEKQFSHIRTRGTCTCCKCM